MPKFNVDITKWRKDVRNYYIPENIYFFLLYFLSLTNTLEEIKLIYLYNLIIYDQYPFLEKIWTSYEEFNQTVDETDEYKAVYVAMCEQIMGQVHDKEEWYNDLCIKLIRNLGTFSFMNNKDKYNHERCKNLNSWLYYIIKDYEVNQAVITNIFEESNKIVVEGSDKFYCYNYLYKDKYKDPDKIIKLINLEDYMSDFLSILKNDIDKNHCSCRKFIYECTKIYNDMYSDYCSDVKTDTNNDGTCTQLSTFSKFYESFISTKQDLKGKLPSLSDDTLNDIVHCELEKPKEELNSINSEDHKPDSPIKIDTNAVLGTMAGVSSLFALSYKFTPLGKWFRPRHLRATVPSNNMGKQGEYELFHNGPENENISFEQTKYNVAYSPL